MTKFHQYSRLVLLSGFFFLGTRMACAGGANPAQTMGNWNEPEAWNWRPSHDSSDVVAQVPGSEDTVFISSSGEDITMELAEVAAPVTDVLVGSPNAVAHYQLNLKKGAFLETQSLTIGRSGAEQPMGIGFVDVASEASLTVKYRTVIGGEGANNGTLAIRDGMFSTGELEIGTGGTEKGSRLVVEGSKGTVTIGGNAKVIGRNEPGAGSTLEFVFDADGVSPVSITGQLKVVGSPAVQVDLKAFRPKGLPAEVVLVEVNGTHSGDFSPAEIKNSPAGGQATVDWTSRGLVLKMSR